MRVKNKTIALGTAWQPTFNRKAFDSDKAKTYFDNLGDAGEYRDEFSPSYWNFTDAIGKGPSTLPGPDALPMLHGSLVETQDLFPDVD